MKTTTTAGTTLTTITTTDNESTGSQYLAKYIRNVQQASEATAAQYEYRLSRFEKYIEMAYKEEQQQELHQQQQNRELIITLDDVINELKKNGYNNNNKIDPYDLLSGFVAYLEEEEDIENPNTLRYFVITAANFLEYNDVEISPRKFKLKVRLPKPVVRHKEAISKEEIREILLKCSNIKLKTYLMLLASTGMRATEALALRHKDFDFDDENSNNNNNRQAFVRIRGEFTKTRTDRYVFLTREMVEQCKAWADFKYRRRRITRVVNTAGSSLGGKAVSYWLAPKANPDDLFFAMPRKRKRSGFRGLYVSMNEEFAHTLDRIGFGNREDGNKSRRVKTFHSFRRFVKTTISDLGYQDFSEWFIGHSGSTYWRKKDSEKAELFRKIEPYLTFLDITGLESKGADMETKTEQMMAENLSLKQQVDELYRILYMQGIIKKEA